MINPIQKDTNDNPFIDVGDVFRITFIHHSKRIGLKDWSGCDTIRIQAYKNPHNTLNNRSLYPGPELPIKDSNALFELIEALCAIYRSNTLSEAI